MTEQSKRARATELLYEAEQGRAVRIYGNAKVRLGPIGAEYIEAMLSFRSEGEREAREKAIEECAKAIEMSNSSKERRAQYGGDAPEAWIEGQNDAEDTVRTLLRPASEQEHPIGGSGHDLTSAKADSAQADSKAGARTLAGIPIVADPHVPSGFLADDAGARALATAEAKGRRSAYERAAERMRAIERRQRPITSGDYAVGWRTACDIDATELTALAAQECGDNDKPETDDSEGHGRASVFSAPALSTPSGPGGGPSSSSAASPAPSSQPENRATDEALAIPGMTDKERKLNGHKHMDEARAALAGLTGKESG